MGVFFVMDLPVLALRRTVLGSSRMACVIVPLLMNGPRSCGSLRVLFKFAVWLGNFGTKEGGLLPTMNGVIFAAGMFGGPKAVVVVVGATP